MSALAQCVFGIKRYSELDVALGGLLADQKPSFGVQYNQCATLCFPEPSQRG